MPAKKKPKNKEPEYEVLRCLIVQKKTGTGRYIGKPARSWNPVTMTKSARDLI